MIPRAIILSYVRPFFSSDSTAFVFLIDIDGCDREIDLPRIKIVQEELS